MKFYLTLSSTIVLSAVLLMSARTTESHWSAQAPAPNNREETLKKYQAVFKHPFDVEARQAYMDSLPKVGDYYVVEGDIALTEQELRAYILANSSGAEFATPDSAELIVNIHSGNADYYPDPAQRKLTYAVDRKSFADDSRYQQVVTSVGQASKSWRDACPSCGVEFIYKPEFDDAPSPSKVSFVVRSYDMGGALVALAFFPHDEPAKRYLNIDPIYFSAGLKTLTVGVLRHELGHVLGYRHEHIRGESGCYNGGEDNKWLALTSYDSNSVMHYFCRGDATNLTLELTSVDRDGHKKLYGAAAGPSPTPAAPAGFTLPQEGITRLKIEEAYKAVLADPFDNETIRGFMKALPRDGEFYVVEGDLLLTEQELRSYIVSKSLGVAPADPGSPELIVNVNEGERDYYRDPRLRDLTYVIDRASFPQADQYQQVVLGMEQAGKAWKSACSDCGVRFTHLKKNDDSPAQAGANFTVRYHDASGVYVAASFFPHDDSSKRFLNIDRSYFAPQLQLLRTGVLRHELGHILGYRHEHIRGVVGCYQEDNRWQLLTPYDAKSVMHYFCGGGGNPRLELSQSDKEGHRKLYGTFLSASLAYLSQSFFGPKLTVRLEGGDVSGNAAKVISVLTEMNLVKLGRHKVDEGDTLESIYKKKLDLPFFSEAMKDLAEKLNKADFKTRPLKVGQKILYPDVDFSDYDFSIEFDRNSKRDRAKLEDLRLNWQQLIKDEKEKAGLINVILIGFELTVRVDSAETLQRLREALLRLNLPPANVLILADKKKERAERNVYFTEDTPPTPLFETTDTFWKDYVKKQKGKFPANIQADLVSLSTDNRGAYRDALKKCAVGNPCPTVILIDQPVDRHPDIAAALEGGNEPQGLKELLTEDGTKQIQQIEEGPYEGNSDHGTFMAGIIASQDNKFGLVGLDPGAKLVPFKWLPDSNVYSDEDGPRLEKEIQRRSGGTSIPIFVFASQWDYNNCSAGQEAMILGNIVTRTIKRLRGSLWIVAAGQTNADKGEEIGPNYCHGPMNLGNLPNVLVVTAYFTDPNGTPHLMADANYSTTGYVHLAAPGGGVVSTMRFSKYAREAGTSPSTAFVAGVASALVDTWPYYWKDAATRVKLRLQLTATPSFEPQDARKVATGIVNPLLALYDPEKIWFQRRTKSFEEITPTCWNTPTLLVRNPITRAVVENGTVATEQIRRIYKVPNTNPERWVIYTAAFEDGEIVPGRVVRIGPGLIDFNSTEPLITTNAETLSLSVINDLIFPEATDLGACKK